MALAFLWVLVTTRSTFGDLNYAITAVGFGGTSTSTALNINAAGDVIGYVRSTPTSSPTAYVYHGGTYTYLFSENGQYSYATALTVNGSVVGTSSADVTPAGSGTPVGGSHGVEWVNGQISIKVGSLGGPYTSAGDVNSSGTIVGMSSTSFASGSPSYAYKWSGGTITSLGTLGGGGSSNATGINTAGQIVGYATASSGSTRAVEWQNNTITDLGTLGGSSADATDINDAGTVVGYSALASGVQQAFIRDALGTRGLGTLGTSSSAYGLNNVNQVVGTSLLADGTTSHAFIYQGSAIKDLNSLIDPASGWVLNEARAINDNGVIVGTGLFDGVQEGYILTPTPEPSSLLLACSAAAVCIGRHRRRR
jgi:probable HAF family extracellular repeat protein